MGTWGPGNFDSDDAGDYFDWFLMEIVKTISFALSDEAENIRIFPNDFPDYLDFRLGAIMVNVDVLAHLSEHYRHPLQISEADVKRWEEKYLNKYDKWFEEALGSGSEDERRKVIVETFNRLTDLVRYWENPSKTDNGNTDLPFFENHHRQLAEEIRAWCETSLPIEHPHTIEETDAVCQQYVRLLGEAGWLGYCAPADYGGALPTLDSRALCIIRETLAYYSGLADFAFAMQGLGSGAITLYGSPELKAEYLPKVASGEFIAAFALSEPDAGSDAGALTTSATLESEHYALKGYKTWISNGGIADFYTIFARSETTPGAKGISAFILPADTPGLTVSERIEVIAPHPLAVLNLENCRVPVSHRLGEAGQGFKVAMQTLDIFRAAVAAASVGFARRALDESLGYAKSRQMFGQTLADFQMTQAKLADMATMIDASALLTYRAAWLRDVQGIQPTKEVAMAKMTATESAQQVIDAAVQIFGGLGVKRGQIVEQLYREIRALRIYEGATEVQKLIIARALLKE